MDATVIGVDAHKRSHTAVVLDDDEEILEQVKVVADRRQVARLQAWSARWPDRVWAIENAYGLGRLLAQQLVGRGEAVVDVPGRLTARTRRLSGHSARKSDEFDARSVAIVGANHTGLRRVELDDTPAELGVLLDRRWHLVSARHRVICRFHDRITELTAGGANKALSPTAAAKALRAIHTDNPADAARRQAAKDMLAEWRWLTRRINEAQRRLDQAVAIHGTTLTDIVGIGTTSAAAIIAIVDRPDRFPTRGHFASYNGTAPVDASSGDQDRHRLNRRGNRQLNKVLHTAAVTQIRMGGRGRDYYERKLSEGKKHLEALRCLKRQLSDVIYRRLLADEQHKKTVRDGHSGTSLMAA